VSSAAGVDVEGFVAPGFDGVAHELGRQLTASPGSGAAFAAFVDGVPVIDLWGGQANAPAGELWREDTIQLVFSGTKGLAAVCLLMLVERGALDLGEPVARYWPAFAQAGKAGVTVAQVMGHTAGVPGLRGGFALGDLLDGDAMRRRVEAEAPFWEPGSRLAYHALTFGWLCDGLVRHADGRSIGTFFSEEVAKPLGLELWIGLPAEQEGRVAQLHRGHDYTVTFLGDEPEPLLLALYGSFAVNPELELHWNDGTFHEVEIPAANAIGTARSIARLYACLARGGELDGVRLLDEETVRLGRTELSRGPCAVTRRPYAYGVGFELQTELMRFGPELDAFGHTGSGGSSHGAWPSRRVGFSYAMNELRLETNDDRATRLLAALDASPGLSARLA
jgi:CubicO group peptidase (beta-lactamase class C family)